MKKYIEDCVRNIQGLQATTQIWLTKANETDCPQDAAKLREDAAEARATVEAAIAYMTGSIDKEEVERIMDSGQTHPL